MNAVPILVLLVSLLAATGAPPTARPTPFGPQSGGARAALVYGEGHAYWLTAPDGWVLDGRAGAEQGLFAVFYPAGSTWSSAPAVMYTTTSPRDSAADQPLEASVDADMARARAMSPGLRVARVPPLTTQDGKHAEVRLITGDRRGNNEAVAFIGEGPAVVVVTLTSRDLDRFTRAYPAFESVVRSYSLVTAEAGLR